MKQVYYSTLLLVLLTTSQGVMRPSICPISKQTAIGTSVAIGGTAGFISYKGFSKLLPDQSDNTHYICGAVAAIIAGGISYEILSTMTPEFHYTQAERKINDTLSDILFNESLSTKDFLNQVNNQFMLSSWSLAEAHDHLSNQINTARAAQKVLVEIMQECRGGGYESLIASCNTLLLKLKTFNAVAQERLETISSHEQFAIHRERQQQNRINELMEQKKKLQEIETMNGYLNVANNSVDLISGVSELLNNKKK